MSRNLTHIESNGSVWRLIPEAISDLEPEELVGDETAERWAQQATLRVLSQRARVQVDVVYGTEIGRDGINRKIRDKFQRFQDWTKIFNEILVKENKLQQTNLIRNVETFLIRFVW